jgi:general secretion pathway protein D
MSQSRIVSVVAVLAAALLFVPLLTAQAVISAGSTDAFVDQIFTLPVSIADVSDLYAFQFDLAFDPSILQLLSISEGSFLPSAGSTIFIPGDIDNIGGTATSNADTLVGDIPGASGDGDLVDFTFLAIDTGTSAVTLSNGLLFDSSFNDIPFTTVDGSVTVSAATPEPAGLSCIGCLAVAGMLLAKRWRRAGRRA